MAEISEVDSTLTPTDHSMTFSPTLDSSNSAKLDITREEFEKRQLLHNLQLLKLEISQKNLMIETLKNDQASQYEELREKLSDSLHERRLLQMRLKSMTHAYEEEMKHLQQRARNEIAAAQERQQQQYEDSGPVLARKQEVEEIKQSLHCPEISESEYQEMRAQDTDTLPLKEYIRLRYYELTQPLQRKCRELRQTVGKLSEQMASSEEEVKTTQDQLGAELARVKQLESQCSRLTRELAQTRTLVQEGNYKIDNFDAVKRERDGLQSELDTLRHAMVEMEGASKISREEREQAKKELSSAQQAVALLRQDKEYLVKQVGDLGRRANMAEERCEALSHQLADVKLSKEKIYEQFLKSKENQKVDYDQRLQQEVESLRARTALEMEQLKTQTREMFERENRSLCESRDNAFAERDRALVAEREMSSKYEQLLKESRRHQLASDERVSELQAELQVRKFECERMQMVHEETVRDLKHCQLEQEKLRKKVEVLTQELWSVQSECDLRVRELESRLSDQRQQLEVYEKLERELDEVVMQAAQIESESDAERVLFSYGFGTSVPSTSRRRMQQSVQLARRVLQLERLNCSLRKDLETEGNKTASLQEELSSAREVLEKCQQPYSYLIESIRVRDDQLTTARGRIATLKEDLKQLREERTALIDTKNQMAADLERLLSHREELSMMKQAIIGLQGGRTLRHKATPTNGAQGPEVNTHSPPPTVFTKQEPPGWYKMLKQNSDPLTSVSKLKVPTR